MPYKKLNFNYTESTYSIPTATDGTTAILEDNHPAVKHMIGAKPPHYLSGMQNYEGMVYSLNRTFDPFRTGVNARNVSYFIYVDEV